jgi:hypothetical protein
VGDGDVIPTPTGLSISELFSTLTSPALSTEFGRLPLAAVTDPDPNPLGAAEEGLLSPTRLEIKVSNSLRPSPRPGVGEIT